MPSHIFVTLLPVTAKLPVHKCKYSARPLFIRIKYVTRPCPREEICQQGGEGGDGIKRYDKKVA